MQILLNRTFIWRFRFRKKIKFRKNSASKVHLSLIILCLKRKIKTKMVILRNNLIKFFQNYIFYKKKIVYKDFFLGDISFIHGKFHIQPNFLIIKYSKLLKTCIFLNLIRRVGKRMPKFLFQFMMRLLRKKIQFKILREVVILKGIA